ncbi:MAG: DUF6526 family protein [Planctomycetota bacterium]
MPAIQTYANHRKLPLPYILCGVALLANAGYLLKTFAHDAPSCGTGLAAASGIALLVVWFRARRNAQIMQDRIIRLEMRLRLSALLLDRQADIAKLPLRQLVALRFASDAELPGLFARVVSGELATPDAIKLQVRDWQADDLRV